MGLSRSYKKNLIEGWTLFCKPPAELLRYYATASANLMAREEVHQFGFDEEEVVDI